MKCKKCHIELQLNQKFCHECGSKVVSTCRNCNKELNIGDKFCSECGTSVMLEKDFYNTFYDISSRKSHLGLGNSLMNIYYDGLLAENHRNDFLTDTQYIYKIDKVRNNKDIIYKGGCNNLNLQENNLYFVQEKNKIVKLNVDTLENEILYQNNKSEITKLIIKDDVIYYCLSKKEEDYYGYIYTYKIYSMNIDGTNRDNLIVDCGKSRDSIYYIYPSDEGIAYKIYSDKNEDIEIRFKEFNGKNIKIKSNCYAYNPSKKEEYFIECNKVYIKDSENNRIKWETKMNERLSYLTYAEEGMFIGYGDGYELTVINEDGCVKLLDKYKLISKGTKFSKEWIYCALYNGSGGCRINRISGELQILN